MVKLIGYNHIPWRMLRMSTTWSGIKEKLNSMFSTGREVELGDEYVELEADVKNQEANVLVKPFTVSSYDDVGEILTSIREGRTIALLNIAPIKDKDITELKRVIEKLKKTIEVNEGDIAGFGENWLIVTPSFAKVWRGIKQSEQNITSE